MRPPWGALPALALAFLSAPPAAAQPLPDNHYALDLFQGPILAPLRVIGIAGAYAGYAEGIAGMVANAAAPALREPFSASWFEADIAASVSIPVSIFENNDFDNSGDVDYDYSNFIYLTLGGQLQAGPLGAGFNAELQRYTLSDADGATTAVTTGKYHVLGGVQLLGGQLVIGAGARAVTLVVDAPEASLTLLGVAPEVGLIIRPDWRSFRFGATFRFPVDGGELIGGSVTVDDAGVRRAGGLVLPERVVLPWEIEAGFAVQVGPRPLNPAWINPRDQEREVLDAFVRRRAEQDQRRAAELQRIQDPKERAEREQQLRAEQIQEVARESIELGVAYAALKKERRARYWNWPREHLLITAELLISGAVADGVSLERFLGQNHEDSKGGPSIVGTSGAAVSFSPRFGIETEPIPGLVHTRFGSYYEPNRFGAVGRQHFTFGADLRMFTTTWWGLVPDVTYKLQASVDLAPRYQSLSAGIGVWR